MSDKIQLKKLAQIVLVLIAALAILMLLGPRPSTEITAKSYEIDDAAAFVTAAESVVGGIVPGTEKSIVWSGSPGERTDLVLVYLHGFSATRQETAPLCDSVAARLGANLFYTRLAGHGRDGAAMAEATAGDWFNDVSEAVAVGRALGERVVLVGNSTGSTLAVWWMGSSKAPAELKERVEGLILMSPNFRPADTNAEYLVWPWGAQLAEMMIGPEYSWEPHNEMQGRYWTTRYPTSALVTMMATVEAANEVDPSSMTIPTMLIYSPGDKVVDTTRIPEWHTRLGSSDKRMLEIADVSDPSHHILAGDILSAASTDYVAKEIVMFLSDAVIGRSEAVVGRSDAVIGRSEALSQK